MDPGSLELHGQGPRVSQPHASRPSLGPQTTELGAWKQWWGWLVSTIMLDWASPDVQAPELS